MAKHWSLSDIWNQSFETIQDEPIKVRNYLYASELGNSFIEIYYKLRGVPYTNTFTVVNRRKMEAGKLFESIIRFVLKRAGILKRSQQIANYQIPGLLETHGRLDFVAGGTVDLQQAEDCTELIKSLFEELEFPGIYLDIADKVFDMVKGLAGKKDTLHTYILELKSVADFVYRLIENSPRALNFHHLQNYHYLLSLKRPLGKVAYLNRDDVRLMEKKVLNNDASYKEYAEWIGEMTDFHRDIIPPPKEELILFHSDTCSFNKNTTGVEWCKYLKMIYKFDTPEDYRNYILPIVKSMNYVYDRCVNTSVLTDDNKAKIKEYRKLFPNWDHLVDVGKLRKVKKDGFKAVRP